MAEVFVVVSAVQATTQLLEQAFRVLGRLRKAHIRQKSLVELLRRHEVELTSVKTIIGIIDDEEELQTASVGQEMFRLKEVQCKLGKLLEELDPKSVGKVGQFTRQFVQGSADEKKLCSIMDELGQVKSMLLLRIQVANVGVMKTMKKQLVANAAVIQRIDDFLRAEVGDDEGLRIARILMGRRPSNDGTIPLTRADLRSLRNEDDGEETDGSEASDDSQDSTLVDETESRSSLAPVKTERIIMKNLTRNQALQINAALGEDIWKEMDRLVIKDNVAEHESIQVNHATSLEVFKFLLETQDKNIAMVRQRNAK